MKNIKDILGFIATLGGVCVVVAMFIFAIHVMLEVNAEAAARPTEGYVREAYFDRQFESWRLVIVSEDEKHTQVIRLYGDYGTFKQYPVGSYYKPVPRVE